MSISFGREGRLQEMCLNPDLSFLTHGSYTATPRRVLEAQRKYRDMVEWAPDIFYRQNLLPMYIERVDCVAKFLNLTPENLVLVPNVTAAINTVLKSVELSKGDGILVYSFTYMAVQNTCDSAAERAGASVICVDIPLDIPSKEDVVERYRSCLDANPHIKVAVIDYISSPTATVFPVKDLVALCRSRRILTLIDAAHVPGHYADSLEDLGADFITGNMHKWSFTPKSCALLWVDPKHHSITRPLVTSARHKSPDFRHDFVYTGTLDYSAMLCVKDGIQMYNDLGGMQKLSDYITHLLDRAVKILETKWGTERYPIPADMEAPFMRSVRLPTLKKYPVKETGKFAFGDHQVLTIDLANRFNVICACLVVHGVAFVRVCGQFYNTVDEYTALGDAVLTLMKEESQ